MNKTTMQSEPYHSPKPPSNESKPKAIPPGSQRNPPNAEKPFVWSARAALNKIQKIGGNDAAFGIAVYVALCTLSSEQGNSKDITARIDTIGSLAGLRYRKTWQILQLLEKEAEVIRISNPNATGKQPHQKCTYTLLPFLNKGMRNVHTSNAQYAEQVCIGGRRHMQEVLKEKKSSKRRISISKKEKGNAKAAPQHGTSALNAQVPQSAANSEPWRLKGLPE